MKNPFQRAVEKFREAQRVRSGETPGNYDPETVEIEDEEGPLNRMQRRFVGAYTRRYARLPLMGRSTWKLRQEHFAEKPQDIETDKSRWVVYHTVTRRVENEDGTVEYVTVTPALEDA